jgi:hypothetical protein
MNRIPATIVLLLLLSACGDEDRTQTDYTASLDKASTSSDDTAAAPARAAPGVEDTLPSPARPAAIASLALQPVVGDSVTGTGQAKSVGNATSVSVALAHGASGTSYAGAVRQGVCLRPGTTIASLVPATTDSLGRGQASSDIPVPLDSLLRRPHVVVYGAGGRVQTCAALSGRAPTPDSVRTDSTLPG